MVKATGSIRANHGAPKTNTIRLSQWPKRLGTCLLLDGITPQGATTSGRFCSAAVATFYAAVDSSRRSTRDGETTGLKAITLRSKVCSDIDKVSALWRRPSQYSTASKPSRTTKNRHNDNMKPGVQEDIVLVHDNVRTGRIDRTTRQEILATKH